MARATLFTSENDKVHSFMHAVDSRFNRIPIGLHKFVALFIEQRRTLENLHQYIESLIFVADHPISVKDIRYTLENTFETQLAPEVVEDSLAALVSKFQDEQYGIEIVEIAEGFQFLTKPAFHGVVGNYLKQITKKRLSKAALETLSIIAYKQPVIKSEVEKIRGVSCDYAIQKLLEKELVEIVGRGDGPGRPLLYSTSEKFMNYFGLKNISELPKLKDFEIVENQIGEPAPIEESSEIDKESEVAPEEQQSPEVGQLQDGSTTGEEAPSSDHKLNTPSEHEDIPIAGESAVTEESAVYYGPGEEE